MEILKTTTETPNRPNVPDTLKNVLWAISHMIENRQITRSAPALCNVLEDLEGFTSDDMASLRQVILGHIVDHNTNACVPIGLVEPVELFEESVLYGSDGTPIDDTPPFANLGAYEPTPTERDEDPIDEFYLRRSQVALISEALDAWAISKGENLTEEDRKKLSDLAEHLA